MPALPRSLLDAAFGIQDKNDDLRMGQEIEQQAAPVRQTMLNAEMVPDLQSLLGGIGSQAAAFGQQASQMGQQAVSAVQGGAQQAQQAFTSSVPDLTSLLGPLAPSPRSDTTPSATGVAGPQPAASSPVAAAGGVSVQTVGQGGGQAAPSASAPTPSGRPQAMPTVSAPAERGPIDNSSRQAFVRTAWPYALDAADGDPRLAQQLLATAISENGKVGTGADLGEMGFNVGGIQGVEGTAGSFTALDAGRPRQFAAYRNLSEGFRAVHDLIRTSPRYAEAYQRYQQTGDVDRLWREITAAGYAENQAWGDSINAIRAGQVEPVVSGQSAPAPSVPARTPSAPPARAAAQVPGSPVRVVPDAQASSYWTSGGTHGGAPAADIFAPKGAPILAPVSGTVQAMDTRLGGHSAILTGDDGRYYYLAHGNVPFRGGRVEAGQPIGEVGNSGNARGTQPHLHYAIASDPAIFDAKNGSGDIIGEAYWQTADGATHHTNDGHNHGGEDIPVSLNAGPQPAGDPNEAARRAPGLVGDPALPSPPPAGAGAPSAGAGRGASSASPLSADAGPGQDPGLMMLRGPLSPTPGDAFPTEPSLSAEQQRFLEANAGDTDYQAPLPTAPAPAAPAPAIPGPDLSPMGTPITAPAPRQSWEFDSPPTVPADFTPPPSSPYAPGQAESMEPAPDRFSTPAPTMTDPSAFALESAGMGNVDPSGGGLTGPASRVFGQAVAGANQQADILEAEAYPRVAEWSRQTGLPLVQVNRGLQIANAVLLAVPQATADTLDAALAAVGLDRQSVGVDLPIVGRVGLADVIELPGRGQVLTNMGVGRAGRLPEGAVQYGTGIAGGIERGAGAAIQAGHQAIQRGIPAVGRTLRDLGETAAGRMLDLAPMPRMIESTGGGLPPGGMADGARAIGARLDAARLRLHEAGEILQRAIDSGTDAELADARRLFAPARREYDEALAAVEALDAQRRAREAGLEAAGFGRAMEPADTLPTELAAPGGTREAGAVVPRTRDDTPRAPSLNATPGVSPGVGTGLLAQAASDVGSSLGGGVFGAAAGLSAPVETPEERRRNALIGAGAGMLGGPLVGRVLGRTMGQSGGALATPGVSPGRQGGLPGFESIDPLTDPVTIPATRAPAPPSRGIGEALPDILRSMNETPAPRVRGTPDQQARLPNLETPPGLARRIRSAVAEIAEPWANRVNIVRYAGMLSDTAGHAMNVMSNTLLQVTDVTTTPLAALLDVGRVAGSRAVGRQAERQVFFREAGARLAGMRAGAAIGVQAAWDVLRTGVRPEDAAKLEQRAGFDSGSAVVDFAFEAPLRALAAADAVFRTTAQGGHLMAEAYAAARRANRGKPPTPEQIREAAKDPALLERVQELAKRSVLQEDRALTSWYQDAMRKAPEPLRTAVSVEVPFVRTPYNIVAQGMGMTPAGLAGLLQDVRAGRSAREMELRLARVALGTAVMAEAVSAYANGALTGPYPTDQREASTLPPGWRPWSRKIHLPNGETYYLPLAYLGPLAVPAVVAILAGEAHKKGNAALSPEWAGAVALGIGQYAEQNTFFEGLAQLSKTFQDPDQQLERHVEQIVSQFSPHIVGGGALGREIQRVLGMPARDPEGAIEALLATHPATAGQVEPRQDVLGRPASMGIGGPAGTVVRGGVENDAAVIRAFRRAGEGLPMRAPKQIRDALGDRLVTLSPSQQKRWRRAFGAALREGWDNAGNPSDTDALRRIERDARELATQTVLGLR